MEQQHIDAITLGVLTEWANYNCAINGQTRVSALNAKTVLGTIPTDKLSWQELRLNLSDAFPGLDISAEAMCPWKTVEDVCSGVRNGLRQMASKKKAYFGTYDGPVPSQ